MNGYLASAGLEDKALDLDDIADIPLFEVGKYILADLVYLDIDLHSAVTVAHVDEVCLAHVAAAHHPAADAHVFILQLLEALGYLVAVDILVGRGDGEWILARRTHGVELVNSYLPQLVYVLLLLGSGVYLFFSHLFQSFL